MGKFFLYSHLPGPQLPRLGSASNFLPPPSSLSWPLPLFPRTPTLARTSPIPYSLALSSPTRSLHARWPFGSRPEARAGGAQTPAGGRGRRRRWPPGPGPVQGSRPCRPGPQGRRPAPLAASAYGTRPLAATVSPPPVRAGAAAYVQSWLKEKQLIAASTLPGGPSAASASIGGSTRGSRSYEPATATSAARWRGLRGPGRRPGSTPGPAQSPSGPAPSSLPRPSPSGPSPPAGPPEPCP